MKRIQRHWPFLKSILQEANRFKRQELLFHANADQINALSEVVMSFLKNKIPHSQSLTRPLQPYKNALRQLARRKNSVKRRRQVLLSQRGRGFWKGVNALCQCLQSFSNT